MNFKEGMHYFKSAMSSQLEVTVVVYDIDTNINVCLIKPRNSTGCIYIILTGIEYDTRKYSTRAIFF